MKIPFVGPTYTSRSRDVNYQICKNFYLERDPSGKALVALYPTAGLRTVTSSASGPCRGNGIVFQGYAYFVINNTLFRFDTAALTSIGTINTISGRVQMAASGTQLVIVDGSDGWVYDGTTLTQIVDADFPNADQVRYFDSYFLVNSPGTGRFYRSALNDATSWSATDFDTAERSPDDLVAIEVTHREIWLLGTFTSEAWYNSGNGADPFFPIQGGFVEWGCAAAGSVAELDNNLIWLAQKEIGGPVVVHTSGFKPVVVSTPALNEEFQSYATVSDAIAYSYAKGGHEFYVITFPSADKSWMYDATTQMWSELTSNYGRHRVSGHVFYANKNYAGDRSTSNVYELDNETYNEVLIQPTTATLTRSSGTVTATVTGHSFMAGDRVTIRGAIQSAYNGTFTVTNVTSNTFDYLIDTAPTTPATGTITASLEFPVIRVRTSPHLHKDGKLIIYHSLQINFEAGVGLTTGQGEDPTATLRWSDDGGFTWSYSHATSIGKIGKYAWRAMWKRLGASRDRIFEVSVSDPVKVVIIDADAEVSVCDY